MFYYFLKWLDRCDSSRAGGERNRRLAELDNLMDIITLDIWVA